MTSQSPVEVPERAPETPGKEVVHGYPPPQRPAGSTVVAYCGALIIVRGEFSPRPPMDACTECIAVWRRRRKKSAR